MDYYTVKTLKEKMEELEKKELGDRIIVVPKDEEGNGYRPLTNQSVLIDMDDIDEYVDSNYDDENTYTDYALKSDTFIVL